MKRLHILYPLFSLLFINQALAEDYFYRFDSRPPELIFKVGFEAHGKNDFLMDHLTSRSLTNRVMPGGATARNSAFISMSTSYITAAQQATLAYESGLRLRGHALYIYEIRPTRETYPVAPYVAGAIADRHPGVGPLVPTLVRLQRIGEWDALDRIPPTHIRSVTQVNYEPPQGATPSRVEPVYTSYNSSYEAGRFEPSLDPYPYEGHRGYSHPATPLPAVLAIGVHRLNVAITTNRLMSLEQCPPSSLTRLSSIKDEIKGTCDSPYVIYPGDVAKASAMQLTPIIDQLLSDDSVKNEEEH